MCALCINSDDGDNAMKTVSYSVTLVFTVPFLQKQVWAPRLDTKGVEGVGNGEGVFPYPADYGGLGVVMLFFRKNISSENFRKFSAKSEKLVYIICCKNL